MELIKELYETDIGNIYGKLDIKYRIRKASRAIVRNNTGQIALLYVSIEEIRNVRHLLL
jgi:hypothetical protein